MSEFVVSLNGPGVEQTWLAHWDGDPGRTCVRSSAKIFKTLSAAKRALKAARKHRPLPYGQVHENE